jgi:hypothetical protein
MKPNHKKISNSREKAGRLGMRDTAGAGTHRQSQSRSPRRKSTQAARATDQRGRW